MPDEQFSKAEDPRLWELKSVDTFAECRVFSILKKRYGHPNGREGDYYVIKGEDWVNVVGLTKGGEILLVRQFRCGTDSLSLEVPGGVMEAGEDPMVAGMREMREETGFTSEKVSLLGWTHPNPAIQKNRCFIVLAEDIEQTHDTEWDADEDLRSILAPISELDTFIASGEMTHALTHVALAFARQQGKLG